MNKKILLFLLMMLPMMASAVNISKGLCYSLNMASDYATVIPSIPEYSGDIVIPDCVFYDGDDFNVTSIGGRAFYDCGGLTSINLGNVWSIGPEAFCKCVGLTSIIIPNSVTSIGERAFQYCRRLTSLTLSNNLTSIGERAFDSCSGLTSITIPNSVTSIGGSAFEFSGIGSIVIPQSVKSIQPHAFRFCSELTSISVESGNLIYDSRNNCNAIIETKSNTLIAGCERTIIPNDVTSVGEYAFSGCRWLTSLTLPSSVTSIGEYAFSGCVLTTIVTKIEDPFVISDNVFYYSDKDIYATATLIVPPGKESAYKNTAGWNKFQNIVEAELMGYEFENNGIRYKIGENNTVSVIKRSEEYSGDIVIPNQVSYNGINYTITSIADFAFEYCRKLTSITIPNSVTSIGFDAFYSCSGLTSITIPNSVTSIGDDAFGSCSGLTSITIPNSVMSIGYGAFSYCSGLTSVTIPNSVTSIGYGAFSYCSGLTSVTIPNSVTSIGGSAFENCSGLTSIVSEIETPFALTADDVFDYRTATLIVPPGKKSVYQNTAGWNKFQNIVEAELIGYEFENNGIRYKIGENNTVSVVSRAEKYSGDVVIPSQVSYNGSNYDVTSIGSSAFEGCIDMTSVTIPSSVTTLGNGAFWQCSSLETVVIPNGVSTIGEGAFRNCYNLFSVEIPNSVTSIGGNAFGNCNNLTQITSWIENPFSINSNVFPTSVYSNASLNVPSGKKTVYQNTSGWKKFEIISESSKCAQPTISYNNGKISFSCETEGVEFHYTISNTNSSTGVGSWLDFSSAVNISVYASKLGFVNSDTSTAEIVVPAGLRGDLTGDGQVNVADHVELSKIILGQ